MKKLICLLSMVLALSCAEEKQEVSVLNLADPGKGDVNPDFVLNDIVESITYLQLETNDSIFLSSPRIRFISDKGDYCFVDAMNNEMILIYSREGKLISHFSRMGHGEGEYVNISSLLYDGEDKIEVLYSDKKVIYQYNKKGEYKSKINIGGATAIAPLEGGNYLSMMNNSLDTEILDFVRVVDTEGNVRDRFFPIDTTQTDGIMTSTNTITKNEDGYYFPLNRFKDGTIYYHYSVKENRITEVCRFDLGDYAIPEEVFKNGGNPSDYIVIIEPYKVGNYLFVQFFNRGGFAVDVWDLTTCKLIARRSAEADSGGKMNYRLPNNKTIGITWGSFITKNDELIFLCEPSELEGIPETIDPNGNGVIVTLKLKK